MPTGAGSFQFYTDPTMVKVIAAESRAGRLGAWPWIKDLKYKNEVLS